MTVTAYALDRDVLRVDGPDAIEFLHGQVSQDVTDMAVGQSRWSFLLQPQGKVDVFFRMTRVDDDSLVLDCDTGWGELLRSSMERFKLRTQVDFEVLPWRCLALRGPGARDVAGASDGVLMSVPLVWPGVEGIDLFGADLSIEQVDSDAVETVSDEEWEVARVGAGIPVMGAEIDDSTIPNETDLVEVAVSFTKGCYRGQELVERIHSRGARRLLLRRLDLTGEVPSGAPVTSDGEDVGRVTSVAGSGPRFVALGYVRAAIQPGAVVGIDGSRAVVRQLALD